MRPQRGISGEHEQDCCRQVASAALYGGQYEIGGLLRVADEGYVGTADLDRVRTGPGRHRRAPEPARLGAWF